MSRFVARISQDSFLMSLYYAFTGLIFQAHFGCHKMRMLVINNYKLCPCIQPTRFFILQPDGHAPLERLQSIGPLKKTTGFVTMKKNS